MHQHFFYIFSFKSNRIVDLIVVLSLLQVLLQLWVVCIVLVGKILKRQFELLACVVADGSHV